MKPTRKNEKEDTHTSPEAFANPPAPVSADKPPRGIRIRTLNYALIAAAVILYFFLLCATVEVSLYYQQLVATTDDYIACEQSAAQVNEGSAILTEQVRMFAVTQDLQYAQAYFKEAYETRTRENALKYLEENHFEDESYTYLQTALDHSNALMEREIYAMKLVVVANGYDENTLPETLQTTVLTEEDRALSASEKVDKARTLVFDAGYQNAKALIETNISCSINSVLTETHDEQARSQAELHARIQRQRVYITILFIMNVLTFVMITLLVIKPLQIYIKCIQDDRTLELIGAYEFKYLALTYNNIYEINAANNLMLRRQAEMDPLTGIMNRGGFEQLKRNLQGRPMTLALLLADVDDFKQVNDRYGHQIGDKVLQRVASLLQTSFRPSDFPIRMGGDEFAVLMTEVGPEARTAIVEKMNHINQILLQSDGQLPSVSLSVGVAISTHGFHNELYKNADSALYAVKQCGRCGCKVYES